MTIILFLIGIPAVLAVIFPFLHNQRIRGYVVYTGAGIVMLTTVVFIAQWIGNGAGNDDALSVNRICGSSDDGGGSFSYVPDRVSEH